MRACRLKGPGVQQAFRARKTDMDLGHLYRRARMHRQSMQQGGTRCLKCARAVSMRYVTKMGP